MTARRHLHIAALTALVLGSCSTSSSTEEKKAGTAASAAPQQKEEKGTARAPTPPPQVQTEPAQQQAKVEEQNSPVSVLRDTAMTVPYSITIGKQLTQAERAQVQTILDHSFDDINNTFNKWNPDSELSKLNAMKAGRKVPISRRLERFLLECDQLVRLTEGRFDPTMLPLQDLWQAKMEKGERPAQWEVEELEAAVGWDKIEFGNGFFCKVHDKTALDLGGIAKGHAVDLLVERLTRAGFNNLLVEWGGEIRTAGTHPEGRPWRVFISRLGNPDPSTAIDTLDLNDMSLATSGDYHQSWKVTDGTGEHRYTHVIDPRTHQAVEVGPQTIASVSVLAPKCMVADALATAAMLSPTNEEAIQWTRRMQARLQGTAFWLVNHENKHVASVD